MRSDTATRPSTDAIPLSIPASIAVAGAGAFGLFCVDAYRKTDDIHVTTIVDPVERAPIPGVRWEPDISGVLDDPDIEIVHLATPPHVRAAIAIPALEAGMSVFCEKPLALSLNEADAMIDAARHSGTAIGTDYVMRHHPAFRLLDALASSSAFGAPRTFSLQNFAQRLPRDHWMWDTTKSGGIFVEHGVHFFDAYGRLAGQPLHLWATAPRKHAVEATVLYDRDVVGRFYHEFGFPAAVERTTGIVFFERGYVEIDGWIPERLHGKIQGGHAAVLAAALPSGVPLSIDEGAPIEFEARFGDRKDEYAAAVVAGMRDLARRHRDPDHEMVVTAQDARASLALALAAGRQAAGTRSCGIDTAPVAPLER
ncbi:MAG: Gfo/Idh/MocA family protein [Chloroflexota bacterium]